MIMDNPSSDIHSLSFEQALQNLEQIVRTLEDGQIDLEGAIAAYERGATLKNLCEQKLNAARVRIEKIVEKSGAPLTTTPLELDT